MLGKRAVPYDSMSAILLSFFFFVYLPFGLKDKDPHAMMLHHHQIRTHAMPFTFPYSQCVVLAKRRHHSLVKKKRKGKRETLDLFLKKQISSCSPFHY
jgi:hypothetical protein